MVHDLPYSSCGKAQHLSPNLYVLLTVATLISKHLSPEQTTLSPKLPVTIAELDWYLAVGLQA